MSDNEAKKLTVAATLDNLSAVNEFVTNLAAEANCSPKAEMQLELVTEEIFVNIVSYAYNDKKGTATVSGNFSEDPPALELKFIDEGIPYNPLAKEDPDANESLEERDIGGWGIFLVKKNVDDIAYEYKDGKNILTIRKKIR